MIHLNSYVNLHAFNTSSLYAHQAGLNIWIILKLNLQAQAQVEKLKVVQTFAVDILDHKSFKLTASSRITSV